MRKKDILGNFVKNTGVVFSHSIKKLSGDMEGYSALITFLPGCRTLYVQTEGREHCLAGEGYQWLMYLPMNESWCITVFYSPDRELLQWYFDISKGNFLDENGMPCIDDLFLDLTILPNGRTVTLDADELQEALDKGEITIDDYHYAYKIHDQIIGSKWNDVELLTKISGKLLSEYIDI